MEQLIFGELIVDPSDHKKPLTSLPLLPAAGDIHRPVLLYAVNKQLLLNIGFDGQRKQDGAVKHETLFHNADVLAAGEMRIVGGIIVQVNDHSGSYGTWGKMVEEPQFAGDVLFAIDRIAAPLADAERKRLRSRAGLQ